ncbi:MAG: HD domain-containing protein [Acidobacteriia bacterium]|nr:HD domain-containing protein [Terriglobia bacterium]
MGVKNDNFRRLLLTFQALSELGSEMTAETDFAERARRILSCVMEAADARQAALFVFRDKPAVLATVAARGFVSFPEPAVIPLLPKHVYALNNLRAPSLISRASWEQYLSANGNVAPELFQCITPLRVGGKLVGMIALGRRDEDAAYAEDDLQAIDMLARYVALAVHNHTLSESLAQRASEHLKLLASVHGFYDTALETFANAIDIKHVNVRGHSLRVGHYAAGIAEAMGMEPSDVSGLRAAGYLHDIGKVAVDRRLFAKPSALDEEEFREMADHTLVGYQIVQGVAFPWAKVPEVVRSHHERMDRSGYPDRLTGEDITVPARITAVADSFDAMTSERPYRPGRGVGETLSEIVRIAPDKYDVNAVQALLVQVRRDAVGRRENRFLDERTLCDIGPTDIDVLASALNHKITHGRIYSA